VKLASDRAGPLLDRPDPAVRLFLLSGADNSTSRLHAQRLLTALGAEKIATSGAQLKGDPGWLADEAASLPMFGGKRLIWIEPAAEDSVAALNALLELPTVEAAVVAIAGALRKDSGLARLADGNKLAVHIASEPQTARQQVGAILELGRAEGLRIAPELAERIAEEAAGDLILVRLELQKFALYLDAAPDRPRDLDQETVSALGIDRSETDFTRPGDVALAGDLRGLSTELALLDSGGIDPIPVVRALQRRLLMIAPLRARIDGGQRADAVLKTVWTRDKEAVRRILPRWTSARLSDAFARVQRLERELLLRPVPPSAALGETLVQLARLAQR
jgi:DNA polymerase-3 subunit delta